MKAKARFESKLDSEGFVRGAVPMTDEQIRHALEMMLRSRAIDELAVKLQRLGRVGVYAPVHGQEAAVIGSAMALDPNRDWLVPAAREQPAMLHHGLPIESLFALYMGRLDFADIPEGVKLLPRQQAIAAQIPHAAGLAWALKLRGERAAVMVYCGDGASSEGDFHEGLNLAGVMGAPLIVVLVNNRYAISTPFHKQTAAASLAVRGEGYGMPGVAVNGNDLFAVFSACKFAVKHALDGKGPYLIECQTYRLGFHNTSDNPAEYRDDAEVEAARVDDPVTKLAEYCLKTCLVSESDLSAMISEVQVELRAAVRTVEALPRPGPDFIFKNVYANLPLSLERQLAKALEES